MGEGEHELEAKHVLETEFPNSSARTQNEQRDVVVLDLLIHKSETMGAITTTPPRIVDLNCTT